MKYLCDLMMYDLMKYLYDLMLYHFMKYLYDRPHEVPVRPHASAAAFPRGANGRKQKSRVFGVRRKTRFFYLLLRQQP